MSTSRIGPPSSLPAWLDPIPEVRRPQALDCWRTGDWFGFLCTASHDDTLELVLRNLGVFREAGCYEAALVTAYTGGRTTQADFPIRLLRSLFSCADLPRLRGAGNPVPGPGPFKLYRGVAGSARQRRVRGLSWSGSMMSAAWFAWRFATIVGSPALYTVTVPSSEVLFYSNQRKEEEFVVLLSTKARPVRIALPNQDTMEQWNRTRHEGQMAEVKEIGRAREAKQEG